MALTSIGSARYDPDAPIYLGNPTGISAYADQQTDAANTFLLRLGEAVAGLTPPSVTPEFITGEIAPALDIPAVPEFSEPVWTAPSIPTVFSELLEVEDLEIEPFDEDPPTLVFGSAPAAFSVAMPDAPGVNLVFDDPTLSVTLPAAPDLLSITVNAFSGLNLPTLDADEPTLTAVEPSIREYTPGDEYTSALLTALQTSLEERITDGGTGLNQDVENAIWDRGREREARSLRDALFDLDRMETLGYQLPPGIYLDARLKLQTEMDYANRGHSREVMIKSAELELDNVKHALSSAAQLEGTLINYTNSVEQRLFDSCKYATEAGVQIYNAKVQAFAALVDVYRAKIQAYEAEVRAEISRVEAYKAEIAAEEAKARVNVALVEQYKVQVEAALSSIEVYKAEIAGIQAKAEIEKTKVMVFGEQVRGYVAQVNAYTAGVEGFRATLQAEETKQRVYQSQVEAFTARVNASARQIEARIEAYKGRIQAKTVEWEGYKAQSQGEAARVQSIASLNSALAESYRAEVTGVSSYNETLTKQWQTVLDQGQRTAEVAIQAAKANAELYVTTRSLAIDAAKVGAQVSSQLGAAALNAINWSSSISNSQSWGFSSSWSNSQSNSTSESTNTNYNYSV
jgi:hypothetical protein